MNDDHPRARRLLWVLWPAFLVACAAWAVFFSVFDPSELHFLGEPLEVSRETIYTLGFFAIWITAVASSSLTVFLERSPWQVNQCPLDASDRPSGCPKREEGTC